MKKKKAGGALVAVDPRKPASFSFPLFFSLSVLFLFCFPPLCNPNQSHFFMGIVLRKGGGGIK